MKYTQEWLSVSMEEYKTVRAECLTAIKTQQSALNLGALLLSILIAAAARFNLGETLVDTTIWIQGMVYWIVIPLVSLLATIIWAGEVMRLLVAHCFVLEREATIGRQFNVLVKSEIPILEYAHWLHSRRKDHVIPGAQWVWKYYAAGLLFPFMALGSCLVGNYLVIKRNPICWPYVVIIDLVLIGVWIALGAMIRCEHKQIEKFMDKHGIPDEK